ncbi:MAG: aa3-type cytochrome c oxidase subunit IV [Alphaproteobacteria bacterium]|nr:aa3-type cytochrome c oxidase subunit IV [Alphaproteobacteria bacterium]
MDAQYRVHRETWNTFCKLMTWTIIGVVVILGGMATFLL